MMTALQLQPDPFGWYVRTRNRTCANFFTYFFQYYYSAEIKYLISAGVCFIVLMLLCAFNGAM
jgi:hypothetical protein